MMIAPDVPAEAPSLDRLDLALLRAAALGQGSEGLRQWVVAATDGVAALEVARRVHREAAHPEVLALLGRLRS
jgi:hypothetical protein